MKTQSFDESLDLTRDVFLVQVYTWGSRIGDVLQLSRKNIKSGRIEFKEKKTGKLKSVAVSKPLRDLINKYDKKSIHYILPVLTLDPQDPKLDPIFQKHIESKTTVINLGLKKIAKICKIDKRITTHVSRHTFALWASRKEVNLSYIQQKLNL